jgi:hypothetical protein
MNIHSIINFVLLGSALLPGGQSDLLLTPRLTDNLVQKMIPVLRLQVAQSQAALGQLDQRINQVNQFFNLIEDMKTGKIDPLTWMKGKSKFVIVPPDVVYKPKLSCWTTSYLNDPTAVFSFGVEAPDEVRKAARNGAEMTKLLYSGSGLDFSKMPGGKKIADLAEETTNFYLNNKFSGPKSKIFLDLLFSSPDQSVSVMFYYVNFYAVQQPGETMADGPMIMLGINTQANEDIPEESTKQRIPEQNLKTALQKAGMTEEEYNAYLGSLVLARTDAMNPDALEIAVDFAQLPAEEVKTIKEMQNFNEIRKANILIYNRFAHILEPLLVALGY